MTIEYLIKILTNKLTRLRDARVHAETNGELADIVFLDTEIADLEHTLNQLKNI